MEIPPREQGGPWEKGAREPMPASLGRGGGGPAAAVAGHLRLRGRHRELVCLWDGTQCGSDHSRRHDSGSTANGPEQFYPC